MELRAKEKAENEARQRDTVTMAPKAPLKRRPDTPLTGAKMPYHKPLSARDEEAIRKPREFDALPPEGKIAELRRQLTRSAFSPIISHRYEG